MTGSSPIEIGLWGCTGQMAATCDGAGAGILVMRRRGGRESVRTELRRSAA